MYYTYILRCMDDSLYTGITNCLDKRMQEHFHRTSRCAKYTLSHPVRHIEAVWASSDRKEASKLEYWVKRLNKQEKEKLILTNQFKQDKIDLNLYQRLDLNILKQPWLSD